MSPLPSSFWTWARWYLGHGEYKGHARDPRLRPNVPRRIPATWWVEFRRRFVSQRDPQAQPERSFFASRGVFTAWDPLAALKAGPDAWVAVRPDLAGPKLAWALGLSRAVVWEAEATLGQAAVDRYGAKAYIAQAEGPGQLEAALNIGPSIHVPKALCTNVFMSDSWRFPAGWTVLVEAYENVNPQATPERLEYEARKRGAQDVYPVYGVYDAASEGGTRLPLSHYLKHPYPHYSAYLAEGFTEQDWQAWNR